jgi:hypothetical protein
LESIVFSGWREDRHDGCIGRLQDMGAKVVLTDAPDFRSAGNIFHQMKAMHFALRHIRDDALVLKSRTDKVWLNFDPKAMLDRFNAAPAVAKDSPFARRLCVTAMLPLQPFFINDMMYAGLGGDIRKLISFDMWFEFEQALLNAEQIFHSAPHMPGNDIYRQFYRINPGLMHGEREKARRVQAMLLKNELFLTAIAKYLVAFEGSYQIGLATDNPFTPPSAQTVEALLDMEPREEWDGIRFAGSPNTLEIVNDPAVSHILDMPISAQDSRKLRSLASREPFDKRALQIYSEQAVNSILSIDPDQHPRPQYFADDGGCEVLPSRLRYLYPNDL